jgi:hypothetical protein
VSESATSALDVNGATAAFSVFFDAPSEQPKEQEQQEPEQKQEQEAQATEHEQQEQEATAEEAEEPKKFTIKVDGKDIEVSEAELAEVYKSGMRQDDYTKKTMAVAEERKAAEEERHKAVQERTAYAQKLHEQNTLLQALVHEQNQINWDELLQNDPVEFMKQQHLLQGRQARLQQIQQEHQHLVQQHKAESEQARGQFIQQQREELIAKLPDWSDASKAKAEQAAIGDFLKNNGFSSEEIDSVVDHRYVVLARKAMLYDQTVSKANAAAKKASTLPTKVEKPGVTETRVNDQRTRAFQTLKKSGKVEDAAALFRDIL